MTTESPRTMAPTTEVLWQGGIVRATTPNFTDEESKQLFLRESAGQHGSRPLYYIPVWNGHQFEVVVVEAGARRYQEGDSHRSFSINLYRSIYDPAGTGRDNLHEYVMTYYFPIDPRITRKDVEGAIRAYPNATNTGWLFAHTDEGTHHDYELQLLSAIDGVFQPYFRQLQVDAFSISEAARATAQNRFILLSEFYGDVVQKARTTARGIYLGQREQEAHPREGWLDRDITSAITATEAEWKADTDRAKTNLTDLAPALTYLRQSLSMPSVETRWEMAARIAAEKKAAEAAAEASEGAGA